MNEKVYEYLKDRDWFKNLSMDQQGEICCDMTGYVVEEVEKTKIKMLTEDITRMEVNHRDLLSNNPRML